MSILEELARNRDIYKRMSGGAPGDHGAVYGTGLTANPPVSKPDADSSGVSAARLPPVTGYERHAFAGWTGAAIPPGAPETGAPREIMDDTPNTIYSLQRREQAEASGTAEHPSPLLRVPEPDYPEADMIYHPTPTDSADMMAALARGLETEARHQPQLHREGGDDFP